MWVWYGGSIPTLLANYLYEGITINIDILLLLENYRHLECNSLIIKNCEMLSTLRANDVSNLKKKLY